MDVGVINELCWFTQFSFCYTVLGAVLFMTVYNVSVRHRIVQAEWHSFYTDKNHTKHRSYVCLENGDMDVRDSMKLW